MPKCKGCPKCEIMTCCGCRHGFKPSDSSQSHHICDERGPCDGNGNLPRTDSDRYTELRALVEAWQLHQAGSSTALADWRHK